VIREHLDDSSRFSPASLVSTAFSGRDGLFHHQAGNAQCLPSLVVEQRVNVCNEFPDPGIKIEVFAKAGNQSAGKRLSFSGLFHLDEADGANPEVGGSRDSIRSLERSVIPGKFGPVGGVVSHTHNLEPPPGNRLSKRVNFYSIDIACCTNQLHWLL